MSIHRPFASRRAVLGMGAAAAAGALPWLAGCATDGGAGRGDGKAGHVVVIGGGFGGATAAKYLRVFSGGKVAVTLVEPQEAFVSCPMSNLVLSGMQTLADLTTPYDALTTRHGVRRIRDRATAIDVAGHQVRLAGGEVLKYDKLVLAPGIDMMWDNVEGLKAANAAGQVLQAWKAGPETVALRRQLEAMPDGGTFAIVIPEAPYRCPPGPYERASCVAAYFKRAKPRSKVLILDANPDVTSKAGLFKKAWSELYGPMVEYRPQYKATSVDGARRTVRFEVQEDVRADVLNVLPPMRAGELAVSTGLANANARWCHVNFLDFESTAARDVHVLGDSIQIAPLMPKSGHMANSQAKVCAAAIVAQRLGLPVDPHPMVTNTCLSMVDDQQAIHVTSVHEYVAAEKTFKTVPGSGGVSEARSEREGRYAHGWSRAIWHDMLG